MNQNSQKFDDQEYTISITGKNIEITKPIHDYIEGKIEKIGQVTGHIIEVLVRLEVQKLNNFTDIMLKFSHFKIKVRAITENMYTAIDKAFEKLYTKLRKWKSRIQDHHAKGVSVTEMEVNVLEKAYSALSEVNEEIVSENNAIIDQQYQLPKVVKKKTRPLKILTLEEAVMKMELSDDNFLVYRSEEEQRLKVLYRRHDGSYGVISPE